jgi:hypothetical protein
MLLYWAPVWLPGILIVQIVLYGLKPAQAEQKRLHQVQQDLIEREDKQAADAKLQSLNQRMLEDEIYHERVRKQLRIQGEEPLQLQHDLQGSK